MEKLPLKFNKITNYFDCSENELTTLEGCPVYVGSTFDCCYNNLTSLKYSPKYVGDDFNCSDNNIKRLEYLSCEIGGEFFSDSDLELIYNILKDNLEYIPNFYDFNILDNLDDDRKTLNLKRLKRFVELYNLEELSDGIIYKLKKHYDII